VNGIPHEYAAAGVVTRLIAAVVDAVIVAVLATALYVAVAAVEFLWFPASFSWPRPAPWLSAPALLVLASGYFTVAWATSGRTVGGILLGLRVLSSRRHLLSWPRAAGRAVLCALFPLGLLWATVSRSRRSVQDLVVKSVVVYDWHHDLGVGATAFSAIPECGRAAKS
jgi:uncharacterized RDD family membrane protein YckC